MKESVRLQAFKRILIPDLVLSEDYIDKIPEFYTRKYNQGITSFAMDIGETLKLGIDLTWDEEKGLISIDLMQGNAVSCYLGGSNGREFECHNLDSPRQSLAFTAILLEYINYLNQIE